MDMVYIVSIFVQNLCLDLGIYVTSLSLVCHVYEVVGHFSAEVIVHPEGNLVESQIWFALSS